jgi:hypothetical protein
MTHEYIGEEVVDIKNTPFADYERKDWALEHIERYGQIDGDHHKTWVIDQVARILMGTPVIVSEALWTNPTLSEYRFETGEPSKKYLDWVEASKMGSGGTEIYTYDVGIAP